MLRGRSSGRVPGAVWVASGLLGTLSVCATAGGDAIEPSRAPKSVHVLYLYGYVDEDGKDPWVTGKPPFHPMRLDDMHDPKRGLSEFRAALENPDEPLLRGANVVFRLEEALDRTVKLTPEFLGRYDVLVLASNNRRFTTEGDDSERQAVRDWVQGGGGLVAWSDSAFGGSFKAVGVGNPNGRDSDNDLMAQFGMFLMRDNGAGNYKIERYTMPHFLNDYEPEGGVVFRGEGVSPVRVSEPAVMLAPMQHGGLGGAIKLHGDDEKDPAIGPLDPTRDAALAVAEVGQGRVLATFDRNTFWNDGEGTRLGQVDNREFAQRLFIWVSGSEPARP